MDHFFEEHGAQVIVTKECYVEVLEDFKKELGSLYTSLMTYVLVPARWRKLLQLQSREWFMKNFGKHVISLKTDFRWPSLVRI